MMLSAVVFVLAVASGCLAAQSDRSRHDSRRSGPIRSVPVAADIKRDVDFDCPEEFGYYPHPTDCTLYYVCVFGGALQESCTGGLMYSHELQTCDWPRNVGCDATGAGAAVVADDYERIERERDPPPPPPRRTPPPPPPRQVQLNPVVTSRGQPKFNREEYEKQQQLYAEVDDLPPVEEIENDRQQRVYRGQPSTIGQVQKDRDGYVAQVSSSGRNIISNIIPASIAQNNGKIGSFSFGTQVEERRIATATQAPQTYREDSSDNVTDSLLDVHLDILTNEVNINNVIEKPVLRRKREVVEDSKINSNSTDEISKRNDSDEDMEYFEIDTEPTEDDDEETIQEDSERGKRQIRYYLKNGYKNVGKHWGNSKPIKFTDLIQYNYNPNNQNIRQQASLNGLHKNNVFDASNKPYTAVNNIFSTANPYASYQNDNPQSQRPFKASLPDPFNQRLPHNPMHAATQIITKSPPISALKNNENPFSALAGGFYNNAPKQNAPNNNRYPSQSYSNNNQNVEHDSSILPSTVVTGKPVSTVSPLNNNQHRNPQQINGESTRGNSRDQHNTYSRPNNHENYDNQNDSNESDEDESSEENSSEKDDGKHNFKFDFPEPPYEFTHPSNKYAEIENPFANPNFDFDDFLAKLRDDHYSAIGVTTTKPRNYQNSDSINNKRPAEVAAPPNTETKSSTLNYQGMSTPRPFSVVTLPSATAGHSQSYPNTPTSNQVRQSQQLYFRPQSDNQPKYNENQFRDPQQSAGTPLEAARPKLKPPNFRDDRNLPISYNFNRPINSTQRPNYNYTQNKGETQQVYSITQRPFVFLTGTGSPIALSTPKLQYLIRQEKFVSGRPHLATTGKPYVVSTIKPHNAYLSFKQSTSKPLTTIANQQLAALQHYWNNPSTELYLHSTPRPTMFSHLPKLENLFSQTFRPVQSLNKNQNNVKETVSSTARPPAKRRPIPKPSPEMNDYYYDEEDEQYEPPVKSIYMPSSEIKPQRPPMAQNYEEYDSDSYEDDEDEIPVNITPQRPTYRQPSKYNSESATKNHNDVSVVTKAPHKESHKNVNGKIPVPVMVDFVSPSPTVLMRPEVSNYEVVHNSPRNKTFHIRKPVHQGGPNTAKPPKYLNQTTLRPYTVRHRLAKPTTLKEPSTTEDTKQQRGRIRHHNLVAQTKLTTPRDSHNQETRFSKTKHDDKTNSLEPVDNVTPSTYTASPRPKMLYNGTQNYSPDQYDPFYAVYDEDGELYKDTDYVQQYNVASLRPAVQQTYRGTPPPARRPEPVQYTPRPSADDYDDTLLQGQIQNNQNQYQVPVRHSTRGEGNELGYEHPSSVKTTIYEAPPPSTTPSTTTSTSTTTTHRPTSAPYTEAMTPSRHSPRSSTDENLNRNPSNSSHHNPSDGYSSTALPSPSIINLSSLAKPFEKTDNTHRLREKLPTEKPTQRHSSRVTNKNNYIPVEVVRTPNENKKVVSLTSGFSIRRDLNNTNNPYTLTVLTRPFDTYQKSRKQNVPETKANQQIFHIRNNNRDKIDKNVKESIAYKPFIDEDIVGSSESTLRRSSIEDEDIPVYTHPKSRSRSKEPYQYPREDSTTPSTTTTKYYLKTVIKRPAPFSNTNYQNEGSTENTIDTEELIESGLRNVKDSHFQLSTTINRDIPDWEHYENAKEQWNEPVISPYRTLDSIKNNQDKKEIFDSTTSTTSSTKHTTTTEKMDFSSTVRPQELFSSKPAYYSYKVDDEVVPDHTTEIFNGKVKSVIKAFLNNFGDASHTGRVKEISRTAAPQEEKVVNIGFQKKMLKYVDDKPVRHNIQRVHIVTEPPSDSNHPSSSDSIHLAERGFLLSTTRPTTTTTTPAQSIRSYPETTPMLEASTNNALRNFPRREYYDSKFSNFLSDNRQTTDKPKTDHSHKFKTIIQQEPFTERAKFDNPTYNNVDDELTKLTKSTEATKTSTETERNRPAPVLNDIASTTSTTKSTTTNKIDVTSTTKSLSFPTRASRVNPAIKLAATNPGVGRRSYQSTKCSTDNSLQPNPKCNEIKYQRPSPSSTRGRGSAHFSTSNGDQPQQQSNRGTPPTRSRPTLKPSTAIVSKATEFVDVYANPPRRPAAVYPQPTPDKTAAKCRQDVCLLPDCYCGGKEIPGDLEVETVPQIVLLTFDDSVNDLNKVLYADLFEKGRVNPNGCPISATFYVSHEWTDYSQVQNLYAAGHEMASHTISHSFGEQFSQKKWNREVGGQREILAAYGGVKLEDVRGMRAPFLSVGGNKMFKMLYDSNFTYDSSMPVYENRPPSWPYTLDYKLFHDCMIPPCPTKSYPGVWEVPMVMWQDLNGGRCSMGDACANPPESEGVYKMLLKNFDRHYTTNRAPFGLFYHAAWFTQPHHKEGFIKFLDFINGMQDVWIVTNWQALQWVRDPTPISRLNNFQPFQCNYPDRPKKCNNPKVCNLWHKSGVRYMRTCQPCPEIYPWTGKTGIKSSRIDNDIEE